MRINHAFFEQPTPFLTFPTFMAAQLTFQHHAFALPPVENFLVLKFASPTAIHR